VFGRLEEEMAQRREEVDADLAELEAEEKRLAMPPPPPRLSRREKAIATAARDRQLMPPPPPRFSVEKYSSQDSSPLSHSLAE
jgi:hypothetical protein